jgi:amidase
LGIPIALSSYLVNESPLRELAAQIAGGERTASEVVTEALTRLDAIEALNPVAWRNDDAVMRQAADADSAVSRGESLGSLHGVPVTVKDWIDVVGFPCAGEELSNAERRPRKDATVVSRLRSVGAIVIAKTNVHSLHGVARNPWNSSRTAGRSSSGEAIAVAAGASLIGVGSDESGSLRFPAHCTGVAAIKPTLGRVPVTGHFPYVDALTDGRTVIGLMSRSVSDLREVMSVMAGPDGIDPDVQPMPYRSNASRERLRVLVHADDDITTTPEVDDMVRTAADVLADADHSISTGDVLQPSRSLDICERHWDRPLATGQDHEQLLTDWQAFRHEIYHQMTDQDVILSPAAPHAAPPIGADSYTDTAYTRAASLWGYPAAVIRFGTSNDGLPLGIQLVAKAWDEDLLLSVAASLENMAGDWPSILDSAPPTRP